jgi:hypothetical protein
MRFTAHNRTLIIRTGVGQTYWWELPYYDAPLDDLLLTSRRLSAHRIDDAGGLIPLSKVELRELWQRPLDPKPASRPARSSPGP